MKGKKFITFLTFAALTLSLCSCSLEDLVKKSMEDELGTRPSAVEEMAQQAKSGATPSSPSSDNSSKTSDKAATSGSSAFPYLVTTDGETLKIADSGFQYRLPENNVFENENSEDFLRFAEYGSTLVMAATIPGETNKGIVVTCFEGRLLQPTDEYLDNYAGLLAEAFATDNGKADVRTETVTLAGDELSCRDLHILYAGNAMICRTFLIGSGVDRYQVIIFESSQNGVDAYTEGFFK